MSIVRGLFALLCFAAGTAVAHDSWLAKDGAGRWQVSTGSRYPLADAGTMPVQPQCRSRGGATACWIELPEHEIELGPELVDAYLREIRPPRELLDAWAAMKADGIVWRERYRKFARIEMGTVADAAVRAPAGLPLEIVIDGDEPLRVGRPVGFRVLSHGKPVAGFAVELVSSRSKFGVWQRSDEAGRLRHVLPFGGEWVLRGTLLEREGDAWRSRFVTLAIAPD